MREWIVNNPENQIRVSIARQLAHLVSLLPPNLLLQPSASDTTIALIRRSCISLLTFSTWSTSLCLLLIMIFDGCRWSSKALVDGSPDVRSFARQIVARLMKEEERWIFVGRKCDDFLRGEMPDWLLQFLFQACSQVWWMLEGFAGRRGGKWELQESCGQEQSMKLPSQKLPNTI